MFMDVYHNKWPERMSKKGEIGVDELELRCGLNTWEKNCVSLNMDLSPGDIQPQHGQSWTPQAPIF